MPDSLYIVDTHTLIWYLTDDTRLGHSASLVLDDSNARLLIPSIVLAEALFTLERRPHLYALSETGLLKEVGRDRRMNIAVLDQEIISKTLACKAILEMHDRQIVATALLAQEAGVNVAILTRDGNITNSGLIPCVW